MRHTHPTAALIAWFTLLVFAVGCGEDPGTNNADPQQSQPDERDCPDGQQFHPFQQQCVDAGDATGDDGDDDTDDDVHDDSDDADPAQDCRIAERYDDQQGCIPDCEPGALTGRTCVGGHGLFPGAELRLEGENCEADSKFSMRTFADQHGHFEFAEVPPGEHRLEIVSGDLAELELTVVTPGQTTDLYYGFGLASLTCPYPRAALVEGSEQLSSLLDTGDAWVDRLGPAPEDVVFHLEESVSDITTLDLLLVEDGAPWAALDGPTDLADFGELLETFVDDHGLLFATADSHPYAEAATDGSLGFDETSDASVVDVDEPVDAEIRDPRLVARLSSYQLTLEPTDTPWVVPTDVDDQTDVLLEGDIQTPDGELQDAPLMVEYEPDAQTDGRLVFTAFDMAAPTDQTASSLLSHAMYGVSR